MIVAVGIDMAGEVFSLPPPARHHDLIENICTIRKLESLPTWAIQGFLTRAGDFLNREDAREHALAVGQVAMPLHGTMLFSEDLW